MSVKHKLIVIVQARSKRQCDDMVEVLARASCDIANSYDGVFIDIYDAAPKNPIVTKRNGRKYWRAAHELE